MQIKKTTEEITMPFSTSKLCKCCGITKDISEFRFKRESKRPAGFYLSTCKACEKEKFIVYRNQNREYFRIANRVSYLKKVGSFSRRSPLEMTDELRKEWKRDKSLKRATRANKPEFYGIKNLQILYIWKLTNYINYVMCVQTLIGMWIT